MLKYKTPIKKKKIYDYNRIYTSPFMLEED